MKYMLDGKELFSSEAIVGIDETVIYKDISYWVTNIVNYFKFDEFCRGNVCTKVAVLILLED